MGIGGHGYINYLVYKMGVLQQWLDLHKYKGTSVPFLRFTSWPS